MNITLVLVILIIVTMGLRGFKKGLVKEVSEILSLGITLFTVLLLLMLYLTFRSKEIKNLLITVIILIIISTCYVLSKLLLKSFKILCKLPLVKYINKLLGIVGGAFEGVLLVWIFYLLNDHNIFGNYSNIIRIQTAASEILTFIYENNYLIKMEII